MMYLQSIAQLIKETVARGVEIPPQSNELFLLYALLVRAKGEGSTASDVHDAWAVWMHEIDPNHPAIIPFERLDSAKREQDLPFLEAIHTVSKLQSQAR